MLGESSVGRRVFDLLRIMQLLRTEAKDPAGFRLRLVGRGQGAIIAALAALLDEGGPAVAVDLVHPPLSCAAWTEVALCTWPVSSFMRGLLAHCDLPEIYRALCVLSSVSFALQLAGDVVSSRVGAGATASESLRRGMRRWSWSLTPQRSARGGACRWSCCRSTSTAFAAPAQSSSLCTQHVLYCCDIIDLCERPTNQSKLSSSCFSPTSILKCDSVQ